MKRITSLLLSVFMIVGLCTFCAAAADQTEWVDSGIDYTESTETFDMNPGRGFAPYTWYTLRKDGSAKKSDRITKYSTGCYDIMFDLGDFSAGYDRVQSGYPTDHSSQVGGQDLPLGDDALQAIRDSYQAAREQGVQLVTRFGYTPDSYVGTEPADFDIMLLHIEQVAEIINEYKDVILTVGCGMIGPWGEMHSSKYETKEYSKQIIDKWVKCLDEDITIQMRHAGYIINYIHTLDIKLIKELPYAPDHPAYRFGLWNDGYLGTNGDYGTWGSGAGFNRTQGVQFLKYQALRIPYGGELAYADLATMQGNDAPVWWKDRLLKELYDTHLQYLHNIKNGPTPEQELRKEIFNMDEFAFDGMPDISSYEGQNMSKVMLDHMGYRFVIRKAETTGTANKGDVVRLRGTIENVGFGNLLKKVNTELIVIDPEGEVTALPLTLDPTEWQTCTTNDYSIMLSVPNDAPAGEYQVCLRMCPHAYGQGSADCSIHIANNNIWQSDVAANLIGSFTVTDQVGGVASGYKAAADGRFDDVKSDQWFYEAVNYANVNGLMNGTSDTVFAPDMTTWRAMLVQVLYNLEGKPSVDDVKNPFSDVKESNYYYAAVKWAYANKIVTGKSDTTFAPEVNMTRQELATILYRYAQYKGMDVSAAGDLSGFADKDKVAGWALPAVTWANGQGIITGIGNTIAPEGNATRAQMATMLMRYIRLIAQ